MHAKIRISENNTKQKITFLFLLSSESIFDEVKDTNYFLNSETLDIIYLGLGIF